MPPLALEEVTVGTVGTYAGLGSLLMILGGVGKWMWDEIKGLRKDRIERQAKNKEEAEKKAEAKEGNYILQLENTNTRLVKEKDDFIREAKERDEVCDKKDGTIADLRVYIANQKGYIRYLQSLLKNNNTPFDIWNGSGPPNPDGTGQSAGEDKP